MPLTARSFITRRANRNAEFLTHLVPQMDYLENLFRKTIDFMNSVEPKDSQLIEQYKTMADALHTVAHSHESIFNSQSSLQNALNTLGGLPDFLEADNGANLRQLQATADDNLTLLNDVPQQDKFKNVLQHVLDVNSFCELGYGMRSMNRTDSIRRERFDAKRDADEKRGEPFRYNTGRQVRLLAFLLRTAAEDLRQNGGDSARINNLEYAARRLGEVAKRGQLFMENAEVESSLRGLQSLPEILEADENVKLLGETLKAHPEALEYLPMNPKDKNYRSYREKTLPDHIQDVLVYFDLPASPELMSDLDAEKTRALTERKDLADRRKENERLRKEEQEEKREQEVRDNVKAEEEKDQAEDGDELRRKENLQAQEENRKQQQYEKYKQFRDENGAFSLPEDYDNRDVAGMFVLSAKQQGPEYNALRTFSGTLNKPINEWNDYAATEYAKRLPQVLQDMPENATAEQMAKGIDDVLASVSAEEKEKLVRAYYPQDYEQRLESERSKLPQGAEAGQALTNLYRAVLTEQYRDDLRRKTYTSDKIRNARQEASIELARRKLEQSSQKEKREFNQQRDAQMSDEIAKQIKAQIIEAYRDQKNIFVNEKWFPSVWSRGEYLRTHREIAGLDEEAIDNAIYETRMGELVDAALQSRIGWDTLNQTLSTPPITVPVSLTSAERKRTPLNVALQKTRDLEITKLTEKSMLLERSKKISPAEIDQLTEEKLPLPENDQQLLYRWARDRKKEQLQEQIRQERNEKFPETAQAGIENLKEMQTQTQTILGTCRDVLPTDEEKKDPPFDYEKEITLDQKLDARQVGLLRTEYRKAQEELKNQQQRDLYPKMQTEADEKLKNQIERDAARRLGMSEDEKRQERIKVLNAQNEARKRRRIFEKDWNTRLRKAREDKRRSIEEAKDKKVEGKLQAAGDAVGALRSKLFAGAFGEGALGQAYKQLDDAFSRSDLEEGKNYREKLGIQPEKRPVVNPVPKNAENKINNQNDDLDLDSEDSDVYGNEEDSFVEDDRFVQVDYGKQKTTPVEVKPDKKKEQKRKPYVFEVEDLDAEKEKQPEIIKGKKVVEKQPEEAPKIIEEEKHEEEKPEEEKLEEIPDESFKAHSVDLPAGKKSEEMSYSDVTQVDMNGIRPDQVAEQYGPQINQIWNHVKDNPNLTKQERDWDLSTMIAVDVLCKRTLEDENGNYLTPANIEAEAEKIRGSRAYSLLFEKGTPRYLQNATPDQMLADYAKNVKKITPYAIPEEQQNKLGSRLGPVVDSLKNTASGKIIKYVPRGPWGNSTAYENALAAISTVKRNAGKLTADEVFQNTEAVIKYLTNKETVRKRPFGRQRWTDCMTFLKQTMPPEKFKEYCDHVNQKRHVSDNPAHPDYVSPETFGSTDYNEACSEALDQIKRGNGRPEDYATMIALRDVNPTRPVDKKQLTLMKQQIMNDPEFQQLNVPENKKELYKLVVGEARRDYKEWSAVIQERKAAEAEAKKAQPVMS